MPVCGRFVRNTKEVAARRYLSAGPAACALIVAVLAVAWGLEAKATEVESLGVEALTRRSDLVVHGDVVSAESAWNQDHDRIRTNVTFRVREALKGAAPGELSFWQWGGTLDGLTFRIVGAPDFSAGEEAILFLEGSPRFGHGVVGLGQGKWTAARDAATGETEFRPDARGLEWRAEPTSATAELSLTELRSRIRAAAGSVGGQP